MFFDFDMRYQLVVHFSFFFFMIYCKNIYVNFVGFIDFERYVNNKTTKSTHFLVFSILF